MKYLLLFFISIVFWSCTQEARLRKKISEIAEHRINLCLDSMMVYHYANDSCCMSQKNDAPYKCVVYVDTTDCSFCMLKRLLLWNDYIPYEVAGKISLFFIVSSRKNEAYSLNRQLKHISLRHDVYIDTCQCFMRKNSFFPKEKIFHTFLLNRDNHVVLVGDPIGNAKIENVLLKKIGVNVRL